MILGAVGTGKTSACMYRHVDQLHRWRAGDQERELWRLILEAKGDFCGQVRSMLNRSERDADPEALDTLVRRGSGSQSPPV